MDFFKYLMKGCGQKTKKLKEIHGNSIIYKIGRR